MGFISNWLARKRRKADLNLQIDLIEQRMDLLVSELTTVEEHLRALDDVVLRVVEMHPGEGWTQAVQNAVANLDTRTQNLEVVTNACAKMLEELTGGGTGNNVFIFPHEVDESDLQ